jgi:hypothetical protein
MVPMVAVETYHYFVWVGNKPSFGGYYIAWEGSYISLTEEAARIIKAEWWRSVKCRRKQCTGHPDLRHRRPRCDGQLARSRTRFCATVTMCFLIENPR